MLRNATATAYKYYCGGKGSNGLNEERRRRRRRRRKMAVLRAAAGYARQLKTLKYMLLQKRIFMAKQ